MRTLYGVGFLELTSFTGHARRLGVIILAPW